MVHMPGRETSPGTHRWPLFRDRCFQGREKVNFSGHSHQPRGAWYFVQVAPADHMGRNQITAENFNLPLGVSEIILPVRRI